MAHFSSYYYIKNKIIVVFGSLALEMCGIEKSLKRIRNPIIKKKIFAAFNYNNFIYTDEL